MNKDIKKIINDADRGRSYWEELCARVTLSPKDKIYFLSREKQINEYLIKHLIQSMDKYAISKAYLIAHSLQTVHYDALHLDNTKVELMQFSHEKMDCIKALYKLYQFTDQLVIADIAEKKYSDIRNFENKKGITLEEIISIGLLGNRVFIK